MPSIDNVMENMAELEGEWEERLAEAEIEAYKRGVEAGKRQGKLEWIKVGKQKAIKAITMTGMTLISEYIEKEGLKG